MCYDNLKSCGMNRRSDETEAADYREFVESVTVSREEMAVLVRMPEIASIEQAKDHLSETVQQTSREASIELRIRGGLQSVAKRFWKHVVPFRKTPQSLPWRQLSSTMPPGSGNAQ